MTTVIGFTGFSNSGKTTLISRLVAHFAQVDIRCAVIKHDAHGHYKEAAGSDSSHYIEAGAAVAIVISPEAWAAYHRASISLEEILPELQSQGYDFIFIEGFKGGHHEKIAMFREEKQVDILSALNKPPAAIVAPEKFRELGLKGIPFYDSDHIAAIAEWIQGRKGL
jgi:molybdopterin-guanine dinucleotide biosynthesis protein B